MTYECWGDLITKSHVSMFKQNQRGPFPKAMI